MKTASKKIAVNIIENETTIIPTKNKSFGAGGAKTTYFGKKFEEKTDNTNNLINNEYKKYCFTKKSKNIQNNYFMKTFTDKKITFVLQNGLKKYIKKEYNIVLFRCPDEAYIIEYIGEPSRKNIIYILEKKEQNVEGSVETKLWSGPSLKREYELMLGEQFLVNYAFCVNNFLQNKLTSKQKKYIILNKILEEHNIDILFGDEPDYFDKLNKWFIQ